MLYDNFTVILDECKGSIFKKSQIAANSRNWLTGAAGPAALPREQWYDELKSHLGWWFSLISAVCGDDFAAFRWCACPMLMRYRMRFTWRELACFRRSMCRPKIR